MKIFISRLPLFALLFAGLASAADLGRIEALLDGGRLQEADSLFGAPSESRGAGSRQRVEIVEARLAAAQGNWRKTDARLRAWKVSADRSEGSGEVLFWLGWSALHQGKKASAESLFVLASAYDREREGERPGRRGAQEALAYRLAATLDSSKILLDYARGLPESPLPDSMRLAALERVPARSKLYPYSQWQRALLKELLGDSDGGREALAALAANPVNVPARRAAARLAWLREPNDRDSARTGYEGLLMKQQQGVSSEFARRRLQNLR
jgi:hypothetical protein